MSDKIYVIAMPMALSAEPTAGVFLNEEDTCEGYTLFAPYAWNTTYLIDNQGLQVNSWESEYEPGWGVRPICHSMVTFTAPLHMAGTSYHS